MSTVGNIGSRLAVPTTVQHEKKISHAEAEKAASVSPDYVIEISEKGVELWENSEEKEKMERWAEDSKVLPQRPPAKPRYSERMNLVDEPEKCLQWVNELIRERQYGGTVAELDDPVTLTTDAGNELRLFTKQDEKTGLNRLFLNITENDGTSFELEVTSNLLFREGADGKLYFTTDLSKTSTYTDIIINLTGGSIDAKGGDDVIINLRNPAKAAVNHVKINGGAGDDTIINGNSFATDINGGEGNDTIFIGNGRSLNIYDDNGDDTLIAKKC